VTSAYLVRGSDPQLRERVVGELVAQLLGPDDPTLALEEITIPGRAGVGSGSSGAAGDDDGSGASGVAAGGAEGRDAAVAALLNAASSPPFMTEHRIVVARDVGALTAGDVDGIVRYLDDPLDTTILVFVAGGGTMPPALTKKLKEVKAEERAPESEKTDKVLIGEAHEAGVLLSPDAARLVTSHLGEDAGRVGALVAVLASAFGPGVTLGADDVRPYLGEAGTVPSYQLTNAIEAGDPATALEILHRLMTVTSAQQPRPMHALQILGLLNGYYRRVLRLDDPSLRSPADAVAALGGKVKEFPARKALDQARALGSGGIRQAFDALFQADLDLKGARGIPEQAVVEVLVVRLARLAARSGGGRRRGAGAGAGAAAGGGGRRR
jgi:DNA polymerase-3 subunit delta